MSAERFFDDLARTLAAPMPRRRAVRVIGASLATLAVPGISPAAGAVRPGRQAGLRATCPDGSECTGPGEKCCDTPNAHGAYNCVPPGKSCCCGNALCDPVKQRCLCSAGGGVCAPKCQLVYGRNFKDCGPNCCQPHERCVDAVKGTCISCEKEGKQTCRSYDSETAVICCPATRGSYSPCCANLRSAACCGPKQQCKSEGVRPVQCICKKGEGVKCGMDCCKKKGEKCCKSGAQSHCCAKSENCCGADCCGKNQYCCQGLGDNDAHCCERGQECCGGQCCAKGAVCCDLDCCDPRKNEFCLVKRGAGAVCKRGCTQSNRCGAYCCGTGFTCDRGSNTCVASP